MLQDESKPMELQNILKQTRTPILFLRQFLQQKQALLKQAFFDEIPIHTLLKVRADLIDEVLIALWAHTGLAAIENLTLIACGGLWETRITSLLRY